MSTDALYETDFVVWTERQAEALRAAARDGSNLPLDWDNLAEEVESVGRSERSKVRSLAHQIMLHLVKLAFSPSVRNYVRWDSEVSYSRDLLHRTLEDSPSLKPQLGQFVADEIEGAVRAAARTFERYGEDVETSAIRTLLASITAEQVLDKSFFLPGTLFDWDELARREKRR